VTISVIVPTKNEASNIPALLATLPPTVELVVCDASTDDTVAVITRLRPERTVIVQAPGTIAEARQRGARASSGDVLLFTDADVEFDAEYFDRLDRHGDWDALCGAKLSRGRFRGDYELMLSAQAVFYRCFGIAGASGSNMLITRRAFWELGGFRPRLRCNEDTELFLRANRRGFKTRFDEHLVVWANDHRRLERGRLMKAAHSFVRNFLLYFVCCRPRLPRLLEHDWGYWSTSNGPHRLLY